MATKACSERAWLNSRRSLRFHSLSRCRRRHGPAGEAWPEVGQAQAGQGTWPPRRARSGRGSIAGAVCASIRYLDVGEGTGLPEKHGLKSDKLKRGKEHGHQGVLRAGVAQQPAQFALPFVL